MTALLPTEMETKQIVYTQGITINTISSNVRAIFRQSASSI